MIFLVLHLSRSTSSRLTDNLGNLLNFLQETNPFHHNQSLINFFHCHHASYVSHVSPNLTETDHRLMKCWIYLYMDIYKSQAIPWTSRSLTLFLQNLYILTDCTWPRRNLVVYWLFAVFLLQSFKYLFAIPKNIKIICGFNKLYYN